MGSASVLAALSVMGNRKPHWNRPAHGHSAVFAFSFVVAGAVFGEPLGEPVVALFVAAAVFGAPLVPFFVAGATFGEPVVTVLPFFVAGAVFRALLVPFLVPSGQYLVKFSFPWQLCTVGEPLV